MWNSFTPVLPSNSKRLQLLTSYVTGNRSLVILTLLLHKILVALLLQLLISIDGPLLLLSLVGLLADSVILPNFRYLSRSIVVWSSSSAASRERAASWSLEAPSSVGLA